MPDKLLFQHIKITIIENTIQPQEVLTTAKAVYEKPTTQVYELEVEGAILSGSDTGATTSEYGYDPAWN